MIGWLVFVTSVFPVVTSSLAPPIPILATQPGFLLQGNRNYPIIVEVFHELNCKDSKDAWPILKQLASKYRENVAVILHMFALPYHRCGFMTTQAWNFINSQNADESVNFIEAAYEKLDNFSNSATANMTNQEIEIKLANLVAASTGIPSEQFFEHYKEFRKPTIYQWKYAVKRGVAGTPWYFVNGVDLSFTRDVITMEMWNSIMAPLLNATTPVKHLESVCFTDDKSSSSHIISFTVVQYCIVTLFWLLPL